MALFYLGSRSRRAAALSLLCAFAFVSHSARSSAQEYVVGDGWDDSGVVSDGCSCDSSPCDYNYGTNCDGDYNYGCYNEPDYCYGTCDCDPCNEKKCCCCPGWFGAEYIRWRLDGGDRLPPLVTASPGGTPLSDAAQLDDPSTVILVGDEHLNDDWRDGYRFYGGFWFDCCKTCGVGADYFDVGNDDFNFTSPQDTIIVGRPFFNTETGEDDAELVSVPNELDGTADVRSTNDFKGAGLTFNKSIYRCCNPCCPDLNAGLTMLGGYRFYDFDDNLSVTENLTVLPGTTTPLVPGTTFFVQDSFRTENEFHGGELGLQGYKQRRWWWLDGMAKVAMGVNQRTVRIRGITIVDVPNGGTSVNEGGLLTSEVTNTGRFDDSSFSVIPQFRLGVGAKICKCISARAGYNVIIWPDVVRAASTLPPGLQVDPRNLPPVQAGGGSEPEFPGFRETTLVAHGLDASVMFQW
jgi:putative beta barrel porin BBP7